MPPAPAAHWLVCQLGAREHYAVARALHQEQCLSALITDAWVRPGSPLRLLPKTWAGRLQERFHPGLAHAVVHAFTPSLLAFEARHRRKVRGWDLILARNRWFQQQAVRALDALRQPSGSSDSPPVLFAYSYAALEPLRWAKARGWTTVLGQIDPGPLEADIVAAEHRAQAGLPSRWQAPPEVYWEHLRREWEAADRIVVNSDWSREGLLRKGVAPEKVHVVPLIYESSPDAAAQPKAYPERFSLDRPLRVLFLGQLNLRKGLAHILAAARSLRGEPIEFWLVGPSDLAALGLDAGAPNLRWVGPVRRTEAARFYCEADVFLFPTLSDGFGLTQLEAQAQRLPVIASRHCGAVVREGENGFVLPEVTAEAIAAVLLESLRNPAKLAAMSQRSQVTPEFAPSAVARRLLAAASGNRSNRRSLAASVPLV